MKRYPSLAPSLAAVAVLGVTQPALPQTTAELRWVTLQSGTRRFPF